MASSAPDPAVINRVRQEVERAIKRNIKGVEYFASPAPAPGASAKDVLLSRGTLQLYHYRPLSDELYRVPILLVMATTNRGYIMDLAPGQSFVEFLLKRGYDVYMMDWKPPAPHERGLGLDDYVLDFLPQCIAKVQQDSGEADVTLAGYCMGGVLSTIYQALHPEGPVKNLACFTTPVNFKGMTLFQAWADQRFFDVDRLVDTLGLVPPDFTLAGFEMLRPVGRAAGNLRLAEGLWNDEFVRSHRMFDRWATDQLPLAGEYFRDTTKKLMWANGLVTGELEVGGRRVDMGAITVPLLHVVAEHDHIVPREASAPLVQLAGSQDKEEVVLKGGHISIVAGANAQKRLWPKLDAWLGERSL